MPRYFIHNGTEKEGPYEKDELRAKVIKPNTPVWCEGMMDWTEASKVDPLQSAASILADFGYVGHCHGLAGRVEFLARDADL